MGLLEWEYWIFFEELTFINSNFSLLISLNIMEILKIHTFDLLLNKVFQSFKPSWWFNTMLIALQILKRSNNKSMIEDFVTISSIHIHMGLNCLVLIYNATKIAFEFIVDNICVYDSSFVQKLGIHITIYWLMTCIFSGSVLCKLFMNLKMKRDHILTWCKKEWHWEMFWIFQPRFAIIQNPCIDNETWIQFWISWQVVCYYIT